MIKSSIERVARTRYVMPVVLALAVVAVVVIEGAFQHSRTTLTQGIALTDARLQAGRVLQHLTDAETAARAFLINGQAADQEDYRESILALAEAQSGAFQLIADVDPQRTVSVEALRMAIQSRVTAMEQWMDAAERGQRTQARLMASSDRGRSSYAGLRGEFDLVLQRAASLQQTARVSLFDAIMINRVALHLLVLISVLGLVLFTRQLRYSDEQKARESEHLASQVALRTAELRELAGHLVTTREDERGRMARELHDELGGLFTAMKLELARLRRIPELPAQALERMGGIEQRLNEGIAVKRRIIENLRPSSLDQLGLVSALEVLCQDAASNLGLPVTTRLKPVNLDKECELTVFRLVQESLTNISKYAKARRVWVELEGQGDWVHVSVRDDGCGFHAHTVPARHHGLIGMRVRVESHAGRLAIVSSPGHGTHIRAELPCKAQTEGESCETGPPATQG
ncbi:MAG: histidine kinase [Hydrogenophaga sp.]|uniref:sensor histidine kinase n=1 Tax=Hydrogenophaga sp. TaxID=1904254 RepID=UPI002730872E|nr:histidine kinase [Hydrogenophaga sp.]MDP2251206.1 histidine kinase [Hydrogenophaga sp.]